MGKDIGPSSGENYADESSVVALLKAHGLRTPVAARLHLVGQATQKLTQQDGVEFGLTVDLDSGGAIGAILRGSGNDVEFAPHQRLLSPLRQYATLHTHPASTPPSHRDAALLARNPQVRVLIVVGADGTWYVLSRLAGQRQADITTMNEAFGAALVAFHARARAAQATRHLGDGETLRLLLDNVWRALAPRVGLRYDRVRER